MDYRQVPVDYDPFAAEQAPAPSLVAPAEASTPPAPRPREIPIEAAPAGTNAPAASAPVPAPSQPAPAATPVATPVASPAAPKAFKQIPVDYDPFQPVYDPSSDTALTKGLKVGWSGSSSAIGAALDMPRLATLSEAEQRKELLRIGTTPQDPSAAKLDIQGVQDIHGFGDTATFIAESIGQTLSSWGAAAVEGGGAGTVVGAGVGALGGAGAAGVGALPGAVAGGIAGFGYGTMSAFGVMGVGSMLQDLTSDKAIQAGLADGTISPKEIMGWSTGAGAAVGALDAIPAGKFFAKLGVKEISKDAVKQLIRKAALKGITHGVVEEGGTEGLQQAISEVTQAALGGDIDAFNRGLSILNSAVVGGIGGAGPGGVGAVVENARIPSQPGVEAPPVSAPGQSTPGGTGTPPSPPAGSQANPGTTPATPPVATSTPGVAKIKPGPPVTAVQPGEVDPAIAAALPSGTAQAALPGAPAVGAVAAAQRAPSPDAAAAPPVEPMIASPIDEEALAADNADNASNFEYDDPDLSALQEANASIRDLIASREKQAEALKPAKPNADINAALTAQAPQQQAAVPAALPQVPPQPPAPPASGVAQPAMAPEPIGTVGAARLAPVPSPVVEGAQPSGTLRNVSAPAGPIVTPAPAEPVQAVQPVPSVPVQAAASFTPAAAPEASAAIEQAKYDLARLPDRQEILKVMYRDRHQSVDGMRIIEKEYIANQKRLEAAKALLSDTPPAATPVAVAPQLTMIGRSLADRVRQELASDFVQEAPGFHQIVNQVAGEQTANLPKGIAPARAVADRVAAAVAAVRARIGDTAVQTAAQETARSNQELDRAHRAAKGREHAGTVKGKSSEGIAAENLRTAMRAAVREMKKPEAERDPDLVEIYRLSKQRKAIPKKGAEGAEERDTNNRLIDVVQARRVAKVAEKEALKEPPKEEVKPGLTAEEATKIEDKRIDAAVAAREAAALAAAKKRTKKIGPAVESAVKAVPAPNWDRMTSAKMATEGKQYVKDVMAAVKEQLKVLGKKEELSSRISQVHPIYENLAIFGRELLAGRRHPGMDISFFAQAKMYADAGMESDFYNLVTAETLRGASLGAENRLAKNLEGTYDEGSDQILAAPPDDGSGILRAITSKLRQDNSTAGTVLTRATAANKAETRGFTKLIQKTITKLLNQMVGDVPVQFVDAGFMRERRGEKAGIAFYAHPGENRLTTRPTIYIERDKWAAASPARREHVIVHEMMHAATAYAIDNDVRGSKAIFTTLLDGVKEELTARGLNTDKIYGLKNYYEFVAEAFSNAEFQDLLANIEVPDWMNKQIGAITAGVEKPSGWQAFVAAVRNAVGMFDFLSNDKRGSSYLEAAIDAASTALQSTGEQDEMQALKDIRRSQNNQSMGQRLLGKRQQAHARHAFDILPMRADVLDAYDAVKGKAGFRWYERSARALSARLSSTMDMIRSSQDLFGGENNPFQQLAEYFLSGRFEREKIRREGDEISVELADMFKTNPTEYAEFTDIIFNATQAQVDPAAPIKAETNKHITKGTTHTFSRESHGLLAARWAKLSPEAQALWARMANHYKYQENQRLRKVVRNVINAATKKYGVVLPGKETVETVVEWVMNGGIDRVSAVDPSAPKTTERTADDEALHAALTSTAETLAGTRGLRTIHGTYAPLTRWGKYFFTATHKVATPAGAVLDLTAKGKNAFVFADKKAADAYSTWAATDPNGEHIEHTRSRWVDKSTGATTHPDGTKVSPKDANAAQVWVTTVQNRTLLMEDNQGKLATVRDQYVKDGFENVSKISVIDSIMHGDATILPSQLNRLINNVKQSSSGSAIAGEMSMAKQANINAITDAYIRQLSGSRAAHRRLKRRNVQGFSRDLIKATLSANHVMAGHLTQLDRAPKMAELEEALDKYMEADRNNQLGKPDPTGTRSLRQVEYVRELRHRMNQMTTRNSDSGGERTANGVMDVSFMTHLFSLAYSIINLMQPLSTTHPVLAARWGDGGTFREMTQAYWDLGTRETLWRGAKETAHELRTSFGPAHKQFRHHDYIRDKVASKLPDGEMFIEVMDKLEELGIGASSGIETSDVHEIGRSKAERAIGRAIKVARAFPEAAEAVNRYTTALAAMRLAMRSGKMTRDQAIAYAVTTVEQTQGGYAAENNPAFMSNKWWRVPLQFKKYPLMYGRLFYGNLARALNTNNDRETRVLAAKTVVRLSAMTIALAGTSGLPFMEIGRALMLVASLFGLNDKDWESWENGLQQWYADMLKWATGGYGDFGAEVLARGATRMLSFDTSSRLGNQSMVLFDDPKTLDEQGVYAWLFDMILGAPGGMVSDALSGIHNRDLNKAVPLPKFMKDAWKGYNMATEGTKTEAGRQLSEPVSVYEGILQGIGFRPASQARQWESGGSGAKYKSDRTTSDARTRTMGEWSNASPGERQNIWRTTIREWNSAHKDKHERIDMGDLQKSLARRKALAKSK